MKRFEEPIMKIEPLEAADVMVASITEPKDWGAGEV